MAISLSALQENIIVILCYDDTYCVMVRNMVPVELFGGPYKEISRRVYEYIDRYKKAPKDHIADLLADKLEGNKNANETSLYEDILIGIRSQKDTLNREYTLNQLGNYIRRQSLRSVAIDLAKELQNDTEASLDKAEELLSSIKTQQVNIFDPGLRLSDKAAVLDFLDHVQPTFPTGIPELDKRGFGPTRKELWLYIAAAKRGKTWMLIQLAKMAAMHRLRVCHITLEMSQTRCAQRYMQAFFAMSKRKGKQLITKFDRDSSGNYAGNDEKEIYPSLVIEDPKIRAKLGKKIDQFSERVLSNIFIKEFATGQLTVRLLESYLDMLEETERFTPDLLIIDYPDLMKLDKDNYRLSIDEAYKDLRGLFVTRNIAGAVVSQGNRPSARAKKVHSDNVAEAWGKIAHADCVITYSQTEAEHKHKLARLYVSGGRNDEDKVTIAISQNYAMGTFSCDSTLLNDKLYWSNLPQDEEDS